MPLNPHTQVRRRLAVFVSALTVSAVVASGASAMPYRDAAHHDAELSPARIDAAAHAATMRAIGAARTARACS